MPGRPRRAGENRRSRSGKARRRGGVVVLGTAAGAFLALGMIPVGTAPRAHADIDDIFQPIIDAVGQAASAADPSLFSAFDPGLELGGLWATSLAGDVGAVGADFQTDVDGMLQPFVDAIGQSASSLDPGLASAAGPGIDLDSFATPAAQAIDVGANNASVPLTVNDVTEPVVNLSVGGGPDVPVLVDTGSNGLVIPIQDLGFQDLSFPTGLGIGSYSGGLDYVYLTFDMPVNFGQGIMTASTSVDAEIFSFPTSLSAFPESFQSFLAPAQAVGVLGIGPNAVGPGPSSVISALPGDLNQGVTIDEPAGMLIFGPDNSLTDGITVDGAPATTLAVSIDHATPVSVTADVDSGGVYGTIPSSVLTADGLTSGTLPPGTDISVYTTDGQLLYSYTTTATDTPTVTSGDIFNTGYEPFIQNPVHITYDGGAGATTFVKP